MNITRLTTMAPPAPVRPPSRFLAGLVQRRQLEIFAGATGADPIGIVVASPLATFPRDVPGRRVFYVTDDWMAGAQLMGISRRAIGRTMRHNLRAADTVMSVSPHLSACLTHASGRRVETLPNGCETHTGEGHELPARRRVATLIGQINERLDLGALEAIRAAGIPLEIVGPRRARRPDVIARWDEFVTRPGVSWLGEMPESDLPRHLASVAVGLTPYAKTSFNEASFPLKTLEYLAAGLPVVTSDLPAARWLNSKEVHIAHNHEEFVDRTSALLATPFSRDAECARRRFAQQHTWDARADTLLDMILLTV